MGDEQVGQPALLAQVEHQPEELGPDRDVEHRDRLVGDDQLRPHRQRARDDDPLALAAGQLVRVAERELGGRPEAGRLEGREDPRLAVAPRRGETVDLERLGHEVVDGLLRVQRLVRVLEDELDPPAVAAQRLGGPQRARRPRRRSRSVPRSAG